MLSYHETCSVSHHNKSPTRVARPVTNRLKYSYIIKNSPYKKKYDRRIASKKSESIIQSSVVYTPTVSKNFPARKISFTQKNSNKPFVRSSSCIGEKISLFDIESIERLQKLLPSKKIIHKSPNEPKRLFRNTSLLCNTIVLSKRITRLNYRKHIKSN